MALTYEELLQEQGIAPLVGEVATVSANIPSLKTATASADMIPTMQPPASPLLDMAMQKKQAEKQLESFAQPTPYDPTGKTPDQIMSETGRQSDLDSIGGTLQPPPQETVGVAAPVTQKFGNRSNAEQFSGGVNYGTDFGVPKGTNVPLPQGKWKVIESFSGARAQGSGQSVGSKATNAGYGNSVFVQNVETGEKLKFNHLDINGVFAQKGQVLDGGTVIGKSGATGNVVGQNGGAHLDVEYYDPQGKLGDVLKTPYAAIVGYQAPQAQAPQSMVQQMGAPAQPVGYSLSAEMGELPQPTSTPVLPTSAFTPERPPVQPIPQQPIPQPAPAPQALLPRKQEQSVVQQQPLDLSQLNGFVVPGQQDTGLKIAGVPGSVPTKEPNNQLSRQLGLPKQPMVSVQMGQQQRKVPEKFIQAVPEPYRKAAQETAPLIVEALEKEGITDPKVVAYALATAQAEAGFQPKEEVMANPSVSERNRYIAQLQNNYEGGKAYRGRGLIQLTHKSNYEKYGKRIGVDLVNNPEKLLEPEVSAKVLAAYIKDAGVADAVMSGDYDTARVRVQGRGALNRQFIGKTREIARTAQQWEALLRE